MPIIRPNFSCPHCQKSWKLSSSVKEDAVRKCADCNGKVVILDIDAADANSPGFFSVFKWAPIDDGRTSHSHLQLAKCGIGGTAYFRVDDPIFDWFFAQRRKGLWTCRCDPILINSLQLKREGIEPTFAPPINFDPWTPPHECGLMAWSAMPPPMYLVEMRAGKYKGDWRG